MSRSKLIAFNSVGQSRFDEKIQKIQKYFRVKSKIRDCLCFCLFPYAKRFIFIIYSLSKEIEIWDQGPGPCHPKSIPPLPLSSMTQMWSHSVIASPKASIDQGPTPGSTKLYRKCLSFPFTLIVQPFCIRSLLWKVSKQTRFHQYVMPWRKNKK